MYQLYPNPTEKYFILKTGEALVEHVSILDLHDVSKYSLNESYTSASFDVRYLNSGFYIIRIRAGLREEMKKLKIN